MTVRGIRGATCVTENTSEAIVSETRVLLDAILAENAIDPDDIVSIFFSVTPDLDADFPAKAAREMGLMTAPLLCLNEIPVPGALEKCIRILLHVNSSKRSDDIQHVYLKEAISLRPDHVVSGS